MSIKNLIENIKSDGLLRSMSKLDELYKIAIHNEQQLAESQSKLEKMAAENAGLKDANTEGCKWDGEQWVGLSTETPATDAYLAEVRNEAGARAVELFAQTLGSPYAVRDEKCYEDGFTRAIEVVRDIQAPRFAYKIRQAGM